AKLHDANVTSQSTSAAATAASFSAPNTCVYAKMASACAPPPTVGNCKTDPTSVIASSSKQSPTPNCASFPPNPCETNKYTSATKYTAMGDNTPASAKSRKERIV